MAESSGKKRKRADDPSTKAKKKVVLDAPPARATISSILRPKFSPPVIATAPGLQIADDVGFQSYAPRDDAFAKSKRSSHGAGSELLLHSTAHSKLDYTAREELLGGPKPTLNHYLGIYDPKTGKIQVVEAKRMVVRGIVRAKQVGTSSISEKDAKKSMMDRKADLVQTFGTKKAKKAMEDNVLNAISPQKKSGEDMYTRIDDGSRAMLGTVGELTSTMASREELQAVVDAAKPVPPANMDADDIQDVYDPNVMIGADILNMVPVREWQEKANHGESIQTFSRYVAARVKNLATSDETTSRLRLLRYMYFTLLVYMKSKPGRIKGTRQLPPREKLKEILEPAPEAVVENIRRKFSEGGIMRKFHINLLMTHMCAFACIIDNFEVDTQTLKDDLMIDQKEMNQYFHEIGGRVKQTVDQERGGRKVYVARLALPLDFPKQRRMKPKRR